MGSRRTPKVARPACKPEGGLALWRQRDDEACCHGEKRRCKVCGVALRIKPQGDDDWTFVDAKTGSSSVPWEPKTKNGKYPPGVTNAYELLNWYADRDDMLSYSTLKVAIDMGATMVDHFHRPAERTCRRDHPLPPFCCGSPMYAAPRGWQCRVANTWFSYNAQSAVA